VCAYILIHISIFKCSVDNGQGDSHLFSLVVASSHRYFDVVMNEGRGFSIEECQPEMELFER
jgi:hypothetical protein